MCARVFTSQTLIIVYNSKTMFKIYLKKGNWNCFINSPCSHSLFIIISILSQVVVGIFSNIELNLTSSGEFCFYVDSYFLDRAAF